MIVKQEIAPSRRILIWFSVALFYFYENILTACLGVMTDDIMTRFSMTHTQLGLLASAFFTAYAIMQIPVGWLIQRFSVRTCSTFGVTLCFLGISLLASTTSIHLAILARILMGTGASFAPLCAFEVSAIYFESRKFAMLTGLLLTFGSLGAIVGQAPYRIIFEIYGFQTSLYLTGAAGIIIALLNYISIPKAHANEIHTITFSKIASILKHPNLWWIMLYAATMYGPYLVLQSIWGSPFLEEALQTNSISSARILQFMMYGFLIGGPVIGYISDAFNKRKLILVLSACLTGILVTVLLQPALHTATSYSFVLFLLGFSCSGFLVSFTVLKEEVTSQLRSISLGLMNTMNTLGGIALPPLIGMWVRENIENGAAQPYRSSLLILPIVIFIAVIFSLLIRETKENQ